jgi:hypothetical protein
MSTKTHTRQRTNPSFLQMGPRYKYLNRLKIDTRADRLTVGRSISSRWTGEGRQSCRRFCAKGRYVFPSPGLSECISRVHLRKQLSLKSSSLRKYLPAYGVPCTKDNNIKELPLPLPSYPTSTPSQGGRKYATEPSRILPTPLSA